MIGFSRTLALVFATLAIAASVGLGQIPGIGQGLGGQSNQKGSFGDSRDHVTVTAVPEHTQVAPGSDVLIAIIFDHDQGWHTWTNSGNVPKGMTTYETAIHTDIRVNDVAGNALTAYPSLIRWPDAHKVRADIGDGPQDYAVFTDKAVALLPVTVAPNAPLGKTTLTILATFQSCNDNTCLAPVIDLAILIELDIVNAATLASSPRTAAADPALFKNFDPATWASIHSGNTGAKLISFDLFGLHFTLNAAGTFGLLLLLLVAALGGLLLNFTPCVLPVIPIKIISLSMSAGNRKRTLALGLAMFLGVIAFWMTLGLMIASISGFTATNQLFQYPAFTISVGVIIAIMAIGMCGLFAIRLPQFVYLYNPGHDTYHGSFMFGVMTAILSTPCTAPFMGAAAAWAATQSAPIILTVFFAIGFGMGLPYFILSAFPKLVERMPRTGPASELIKQVMGLLMLAAAAYFVGVGLSGLFTAPGEPPSRLYLWVVAAFVAAAGGWLAWRTLQIAKSSVRKVVFAALGFFIVIGSAFGGVRLTDRGPINWIYYTPQRLAQAQLNRKVVVMEFTAEWCLNCKALENTVLHNPAVAKILDEKDVTPIKVDLTGNNTPGNEMLTRVQRRSIPLLVVFAPDGREVFKGDFYTVDQVLQAVREAQGKQVAKSMTP